MSESRPNARPLADTNLLDWEGDLAARMVAGINRFVEREIELAGERRRQSTTPPARERLRELIGAQDARVAFRDLELVATVSQPSLVAETPGYAVYAVRWPALPGVEGEGLLLEPKEAAVANVVALPDCDWTPEMLVGLVEGVPAEAQFARRLAESGCRVVVPMLIDRDDAFSGNPRVRMTNQPHREFIYRAAYELGRHLIGFEVQKALAVVDWFARREDAAPVGVVGYGEGALLAFYAAALDERIDVALVSGYFGPREGIWQEPIYRNVWRLLESHGDAEIAALVAPRALVIEACEHPQVDGPPPVREGRSGAAPGRIETPPFAAVKAEFARAEQLAGGALALVGDGGGWPGSDDALTAFLGRLGGELSLAPTAEAAADRRTDFDPQQRLQRQFEQLVDYTQALLRESEFRRREYWAEAKNDSPEAWEQTAAIYRERFWNDVIGNFPPADLPANVRSRQVYDEPSYRGYEVVLDVWEDVFAYGILLLPKDIEPGERRPVVVCQHGLEGRPQDCADPEVDNQAYHGFACQLAERGFIVFAPQNLYIGQDDYRVLQRKTNPLGKTLFSLITRQHERILEWLAGLPGVDPERIAFYGLSYGGKTAMRVPALLTQYCLSICSADYNEWIWKNVSTHHRHSYMFTGEYDMPEFNLGNTFNYAEMSWLICPRPFMVERGHDDGVAPDEWVAYEFARTKERYDRLGLGDRAEMEVFLGPHTIHGVGTFEFLHRHLSWPRPGQEL